MKTNETNTKRAIVDAITIFTVVVVLALSLAPIHALAAGGNLKDVFLCQDNSSLTIRVWADAKVDNAIKVRVKYGTAFELLYVESSKVVQVDYTGNGRVDMAYWTELSEFRKSIKSLLVAKHCRKLLIH